ncbi:MAG: peptidoglycan recognition protein family protein [Longimicrobiales bacterium]
MPVTARLNYASRAEWGAAHGRGRRLHGGPLELVIVHHSWRPHLDAWASPEEEAASVRGIERFHAVENGWAGIGYQWLACQSGRIYEGRGWDRSGAHTAGYNSVSVGICLLIDGNAHSPTSEAMDAIELVIRAGVDTGHLERRYQVRGHGDYAEHKRCPGPTCCPGNFVYPLLGTLAPVVRDRFGRRILRRGDSGDAVRLAQQALIAAGQMLAVDGVFGPETEGTVEAFQRERGLLVDGVIGPVTWAALLGDRLPG